MIKKANKKNLAGRFLVAGFFVLLFGSSLLIIKPAKAILDVSVYNKAATSTLTAVEWNNLLTDFISTLGGRIDGPLSINTATSSSYALDIVGSIRATNLSGSFSGFLNSSNVTAGDFGSNSGGGNYTFPGNVGVGTTNVGAKLFLKDANAQSLRDGNTALRIENTNASGAAGITGGQITFAQPYLTGNSLLVRTGGIRGLKTQASGNYGGGVQLLYNPTGDVDVAPGLTLNHLGNVGIGMTSPVAKMQIKGGGQAMPVTSGTVQSAGLIQRLNDSTDLILDMGGAAGNGFWLQATNQTSLATNYNLLLNPNGGNVGIGTTNPSYKLDINGTAHLNNTLYLDTPAASQNGVNLQNLTLTSDPFTSQMIFGYDYDALVNADKKYTITLGGGFSGSSASLFDGNTGSSLSATVGSTGTIEVNLGAMQHYFYGLVLTSPWGTGYGFSSSFLIEKYYDPSSANGWDGNCDNSEGDLAWATIADVTGFSGRQYVTRNGLGNGFCKLRVTFRDAVGTQNQIQVGDLSMYQFYYGYKGLNAKNNGDTLFGDYDFSDGTTRVHIDNSTGISYFNGGNLGIGATNPTTAKLVVSPSGAYSIDALGGRIGNISSILDTDAASVAYVKAVIAGTSTIPTVGYWTANGTHIYNANSGGVAINTTTPGVYKLNVNGDTNINGVLTATTFSGSYSGTINSANVSAGNFAANTGGGNFSFPGNLGIGTTNPLATFHISKNMNTSVLSAGVMQRIDGINAAGNVAGVGFNYFGSPNGEIPPVIIGSRGNTWASYTDADFFIATRNGVTNTEPMERLTVKNSGNVGIGTTNPASIFNTVSGVSDFRFSTGSGGVTPTMSVINTNAGGKAAALLAGTSGSAFEFDSAGYFDIGYEGKAAFTGNTLGNPTSALRILNNGNVGIGTTTPGAYKLFVNGNTNIAGTLTATTISGSYSGTINSSNVSAGEFGANTGGGNFIVGSTVSGNLGVGLTPTAKLHVYRNDATYAVNLADSYNRSALTVRPSNAGTETITTSRGVSAIQLQAVGTDAATAFNLALNPFGGNVGIGTTNPGKKLEVTGNVAGSAFEGISINNETAYGSGVGPATARLNFNRMTGDSARMGYIEGGNTMENSSTDGFIALGTRQSNTLIERMRITNGGNIGIGTTNPSYSLHVENNIFTQALIKGTETTRAVELLLLNSDNKGLNINVTGPTYASGAVNDIRLSPSGAGMTSVSIGAARGSGIPVFTANVSSGNIGIGTTTPNTAKLVIAPTGTYAIDAGGARIGPITSSLDTDAASVAYVKAVIAGTSTIPTVGYWTANGINISNANSGGVGIGTTNPNYKLDVRDSVVIGAGADSSGLKLRMLDGTTILRTFDPTNSGRVNSINFGAVGTGGDLRAHGTDHHYLNNAGTVEYMIIKDGNVGIGTTTPGAYKLFVNGDTNIVGNLNVTSTVTANNFSGALAGTVSSANVSSGAFGSNTGGGNYSFPGNLGIGVTNPSQKLYVAGSIGADNQFVDYTVGAPQIVLNHSSAGWGLIQNNAVGKWSLGYNATSTFNTLGTSVLTWTNGGDIGIGNTSPGSRLDITGTETHVSGDLAGTDAILRLYNNSSLDVAEKGSAITFEDNYLGTNRTTRAAIKGGTATSGNTADGFLAFYTDASGANSMQERMRINHLGNVGIGTTTPGAYKLFVNGDTNITGNINVTGTITGGGAYTGTINAGNVSSGAFASNTGGGNFTFPGNVGIGAPAPVTGFQLSYSDATASLASGMTILNYASVTGLYAGIRLSTYGDATGGNYPKQFIGAVRTAAGSGVGDIVFMNRNAADSSVVLPGDERMRITAAGNVGINSTNPTLGRLQVNGNIAIDGSSGLFGYNGGGTHLYSLTRQDGVQNASLSISAYGGVGLTGGETAGPEATSYQMFLNSAGNLGIGTTTPTEAKLVINAGVGMALKAYGNGVFTGTLQTQTGSDFAEEFVTTADLEAGTVVVMDDNGYKSVKPSTNSYDKTVVGIVSNNPSIIAGRVESEHKAIIAMMGVVKVKVTSSNGRIYKGDMLTTADKTGYAMKVGEFKPGTVIGKALEDLTTKNGEINVLVNLQ